jgi:hypothetical protein
MLGFSSLTMQMTQGNRKSRASPGRRKSKPKKAPRFRGAFFVVPGSRRSYFTALFSPFPGVNLGTLRAAILIGAPV